MEQQVQLLSPDGLVQSPSFSQVAVIPPGATTVLVGGQNAVDPDGVVVGQGDVGAQMRRVLENVRTALAAAGAGLEHVVQWSVLVVDGVDLRAGYGAIAAEVAALPVPPLITVAVVAGLAVPGALVEMTVTAAVVR